MSGHEHRAMVFNWFKVLNAPDWAEHVGDFFDTPAEAQAFIAEHTPFRAAFPDYQATLEEIVVEGNMVAILVTVRATHMAEYPHGELKDIAPTGKVLEWREATFFDVTDSSPGVFLVDGVARLQQLGVL